VTARFSVFIPVWNDLCWLSGAIESVLAQSYPDWELIIGDNASDEDLRTVVQAYADPRIRYHRWPTHTDLFANFNRTMQLCNGEWLQLLSADDRLHPLCLERMQAVIAAAPPSAPRLAAVITTCRRVAPDGSPAAHRYYGSQPEMEVRSGRYDAAGWLRLLAGPGLPPWNIGSVAISREVLAEMGGFFRAEVGLCADHDVTLRAAAYGDIYYIDEPLLDYTVRGDSDGHARFHRNRERGEKATPMGVALLSGLAAHEARRTISPAERRAVLAGIARLHLRRAGQHRILPAGRGRRGALLDVVRACQYSPETVLAPSQLIICLGAIFAPSSVIAWVSRRMAARRWRQTRPARRAGAPV
jgi:GT2 family glycosyltransferase